MSDPRFIPCASCDGEGGWEYGYDFDGAPDSEWVRCPYCNGDGVEEIDIDDPRHRVTLEDIANA